LGLTMVAEMARLHGGGVGLESQPGKGSRFALTLPWGADMGIEAAIKKTTGALSTLEVHKEVRQPLILLFEDVEATSIVTRDYLEHVGYQVEVARNGSQGIALAQQVHPDLILMDVQMPEMDGLEATQRLRKETEFERVPIIGLTAQAMKGDRERCLAAGMNEYLSKPVNLKELVKTIQNFLSNE